MVDKIQYAVLGHPVSHSLSPAMHNAAFEALGMDAIYIAIDVAPEKLMDKLHTLRDKKFGGVNITVPLKETAFQGITDLDESALRLGAVNTVEFLSDGGMKGYNTDGNGFLLAVKEAFCRDVAGLSIFVLGSGGAGRAVAITCAVNGAKSITTADINTQRAGELAKEISGTTPCPAASIPAGTWIRHARQADLIVQASPVGMKAGDNSPLAQEAFHDGQMVFDLVYMYPETAFMRTARKAGAKAANGLGMLLHQGAYAFKIWTHKQPPVDIMRKALEERVYKTD